MNRRAAIGALVGALLTPLIAKLSVFSPWRPVLTARIEHDRIAVREDK